MKTKNRDLMKQALIALTCPHDETTYKEVGWDDLKHCPTAVGEYCLECGQLEDEVVYCINFMTATTPERGHKCPNLATRLVGEKPYCSSCHYIQNIPSIGLRRGEGGEYHYG